MFKQMTVRAQLMLLTGVLLTLFLTGGGATIYLLKADEEQIKSLYEDRVVPLKQLKTVSDMFAVNIVDTAHKVRDGSLTPAQGNEAISAAKATINSEWNAYTATFLVDREKQLIGQLLPLMKRSDTAIAKLEGLIGGGDKALLTDFTARELYPAFDPLQGVLGDLIQTQLEVE